MAQVWRCLECNYTTSDPVRAGDHERKSYDQETKKTTHYMEDLGE